MRIFIALLLLLAIDPLAARSEEADVERQAATLDLLIKQLRGVTPPGWRVDFKLWSDVRGPAIKIASNTELAFKRHGMNPPEGGPPVESGVVAIHLKCMPSITPQQYAKRLVENEELTRRRRQFIQDHLKGVPFYARGEDPVAPFQFEPETDQQRERVRQFALLWVATESVDLPTHFYEGIAFTYIPDMIEIQDAARDKEYQKIVHDSEQLLKPYEPKVEGR